MEMTLDEFKHFNRSSPIYHENIRFYSKEEADQLIEKDYEIFQSRQLARNKINTDQPKIGDFIKRKNGEIERISISWENQIQSFRDGSVHMFKSGNCTYSGTCGDVTPKHQIKLIDTHIGICWIFSEDWVGGNRAVYAKLRFQLFEEK